MMVEGGDGKLLWLNIKDQLKLFSVDKVKVYKPPIATEGDRHPVPSSVEATTEAAPPADIANSAQAPTTNAASDADDTSAHGGPTVADGLDVARPHNVIRSLTAADALVGGIARRIGAVARGRGNGPTTADEPQANTFITEVLKPNDPRSLKPTMEVAKQAEVDGLKRRRVWEKVAQEQVPPGANILSARFVLAIKQPGTPAETAKARFDAQGCGD